MPLTKALKTRLQKLVNAVPNENFSEFWKEFVELMLQKEKVITKKFQVGDEIAWDDKTGTIIEVKQSNCRIRQNDEAGSIWTISSSMLSKVLTIKTS